MNYFEHNLKVLVKRQPELVEMMRNPIDTGHIEVLTSESGSPTAAVVSAEGRRIVIHDQRDPRGRAREHVSTLDLSGNNGSVLLGFGLGYLALEIWLMKKALRRAKREGMLLKLSE